MRVSYLVVYINNQQEIRTPVACTVNTHHIIATLSLFHFCDSDLSLLNTLLFNEGEIANASAASAFRQLTAFSV